MSRSLMTSVTTLGPEAPGFFPHRSLLPVSGRSVDRSVGHPRNSSVWACSDGEDVDVGVEIGPHEVQTKRLVMRLLLSQGPVESAVPDRRITFRSEKTISQAGLPQPSEGDYPDQTDAPFGGAGGVPSGVPSPPGSAPLVCPKNFFASLWFCSATGRYGPKVVKLRTDAMARRS